MKELFEYIKSNKSKVIAIDGPSGAGKSSLSLILEEEYDCLVFHTDDYFLSKEKKTVERLNEPGGNLDYERLEQEVLLNLNNEEIQSNFFNCMTNELEIREPKKKKSIIVIEGVYSLHPNLVKYYDKKVFLDIDKTTQLIRVELRSGAKMLRRFINEWIPLEDKYFDYFNIRSNVDIYINKT